MFGPTLTTYEYDNLLTNDQRSFLASLHPQSLFDVHSKSYRHIFGRYRNGDILINSITGYGDPTQPKNLLPVTPIESQALVAQRTYTRLTELDTRILLVTGVDDPTSPTVTVLSPVDYLTQLTAITGS